MRAVVQRVKRASVVSDGQLTGAIGPGLLVFLGIGAGDGPEDISWLSRKIPQIRIFEDAEGRMNRDVREIGGGVLLISQFTLFGNLRKGTRPSFNHAAPPAEAIPLYEAFRAELARELGQPVPAGVFGAFMSIDNEQDGPVTLFLDSRLKDL